MSTKRKKTAQAPNPPTSAAPQAASGAIDKSFDAGAAEPRISEMWAQEGCFAAGANARDGAESYCIVIPPPNVTGSLHMGHALNNTLQDILIRWKRMQGFDVLWQPGQDHAGIATQMVVERKLAEEGDVGRREMGREAFLKRIWAWKEESGGEIIGQLNRLGASCDWSRNRFTMDEGLSRAVRKVFVDLFKAGLIYKAKRLVNWDPHFETAISDLEVEQVEVSPGANQGKLWRFRYPLADGATYEHPVAFDEDGAPTAYETRDYLVVATTRPETMLGDTGVAVNPDDPRYQGLIGAHVILPIVGRRIPIVADAYADPDKGTGAVKMTPAHDFNDFEVGQRQDLRMVNIFTRKAAVTLFEDPEFWVDTPFADGAPVKPRARRGASAADKLRGFCAANQDLMDLWRLDGLDRFEARREIRQMMSDRGLFDGADDQPHEVPHGDRSKVVIEPYLTDQWFVDAKTLAAPALAAVKDGATVFAPKNWEKTYFNWLEDIQPWCVSRQLWWGHQIPVWYGPDGTPFCEETKEAAAKAAKAHYGKRAPLTQDEDVLDTWFSSALWPFSTLGWPDQTPELQRYYKTDVLITGFDIIFFWVARMMMMGLYFMRDDKGAPEVPFHTVYVHALVRDEKGKKMSKSLGNVINPLELIDAYGADAVRFTLTSMAAMGRDIKLAVSRVEGYRNFGTKLWNAARFLQMNDCSPRADFDPAQVEQTVNKWLVGETARLREAADAALSSYRFNDYAGALYAHVWGVYCDWYLEFAKPLLQGEDAAAQAETRATAAWGLDQILLLMHPVSPFITEELWTLTARGDGRAKRLAHGDWPVYHAADLGDPAADAEMRWVVALIEGVRSVRAEMNVPPGAQIPLLLTDASEAAAERLTRNAALVSRLARLSSWEIAASAPKGAVTVALDGATANLPLTEVIDVAAEKARLQKAASKAEKEAQSLSAKLGNASFLAKAPEEVVEEQRERLAAAEAEAERLGKAMARLAEMA